MIYRTGVRDKPQASVLFYSTFTPLINLLNLNYGLKINYMTRRLIKITKDGISKLEYITYPGHSNLSIDLTDSDDNQIFVGDILYDSNSDTYFTVFEVPGGYAIESNPKSFGLYDPNDPFPVYESTADMQTSSYIHTNCVVAGNIDTHPNLYEQIRSDYEKRIITLRD